MKKKAAPRAPVAARAGSHLDHRFTQPVYVTNPKTRQAKQHGLLDVQQRIYQAGGELNNFVYWAKKLVSLDQQVWTAIQGIALRVELVDHGANQVWSCDVATMAAHLVCYDAGIGPRVGCPLEYFTVRDATGLLVRAPASGVPLPLLAGGTA